MADSQYAQIKKNALDTAKAIRTGYGVNNADAARVELAVRAIEELERANTPLDSGLIAIIDALRAGTDTTTNQGATQ